VKGLWKCVSLVHGDDSSRGRCHCTDLTRPSAKSQAEGENKGVRVLLAHENYQRMP
jgi:hypothetical protein